MSQDAVGVGVMMLFGVFYLVIIGLSLAVMVLWIIALVDACKREFTGPNDKLMWILVVILAGWIGALIYWSVGRPKGTLPA